MQCVLFWSIMIFAHVEKRLVKSVSEHYELGDQWGYKSVK